MGHGLGHHVLSFALYFWLSLRFLVTRGKEGAFLCQALPFYYQAPTSPHVESNRGRWLWNEASELLNRNIRSLLWAVFLWYFTTVLKVTNTEGLHFHQFARGYVIVTQLFVEKITFLHQSVWLPRWISDEWKFNSVLWDAQFYCMDLSDLGQHHTVLLQMCNTISIEK